MIDDKVSYHLATKTKSLNRKSFCKIANAICAKTGVDKRHSASLHGVYQLRGELIFAGDRGLPQLLGGIPLRLGGISTSGGEYKILKGGNVNPGNKDNGYFF